MEPENEEVSLRYIVKYSMRGGSNIFQLFETAEKKDQFVASRKRWLESQGKRQQSKKVGNMSGTIFKYQEVMAKAAHHQEGGADGLLPFEKSDWNHQGACRQQGSYRWITKRME